MAIIHNPDRSSYAHPTSQAPNTKVEISWDDAMAGKFPASRHPQGLPWSAVQAGQLTSTQMAAKMAVSVLPALCGDDLPEPDAFARAINDAAYALDGDPTIPTSGDRLAHACALVRAGGVRVHDDGTATVVSGTRSYALTPECSCKDSTTRSKWCKHYLAVELLKRATSLRKGSPMVHNGHVAPEPTPAPVQAPALPEAPFSVSTRVQKGGYELQLTIRKATSAEFLDAVDGLPTWLEKHGFAPACTRDAKPAARGAAPADEDDATPSCPEHGRSKVARSKIFSGWYCKARRAGSEQFCSWSQKD